MNEIRINLSSVYNPKGANDAKRHLNSFANAVKTLGSGIGGTFSRVGDMLKDLFRGGCGTRARRSSRRSGRATSTPPRARNAPPSA